MKTITEVDMGEFIIECTRCAEGDPGHREDCLVAFLVDSPLPAIFDDEEERALRALCDGGLLPADPRLGPNDLRATGT